MQRACQMSSLVLECSDLSIEEKMAIHTGEKRVPTSTLAIINGRPLQTQVCKRIQLFARSVESVNSWRELQYLSE
ncbi:hypothetical protein CY35_03G071900 [Sphagnum magellanicum]|nr:hypothetical protein CY35_03G071900 [Sphagnum magellanicum]